ncbi:aldo/keto reductase [Streptomyces sp. NBC_00257]|uniref:aldo/keto reductase n=1 Tax=unclassified Streptomyces TaxID=2593676 RepID=UPI002253046C|nr:MULTISPECIES: aldo/keto reductase [unclassified Streptomyces]MCX4862465.1 aldo/keto reductase [Streptomyces sp. NBC_00906]MCX4893702.1 aldo/keto reductase [Streptomyces sp. NBC_00892]MCX5427049.1 aldo/keto reductase [Streptomyces sp. NBC_00062]
MSSTPPGGTITIAGKTVARLGFGTMRLTGQGTWGDPDDRHQAIRVLRHAVHTHGITHIDTADAYGPHTCEHLIRDALYPYPDDVLIATKVGMVRPAPNMWAPHGYPVYLQASIEASLRRLDTDRLDLCYLHRIDPEVPLADQLGTLQALQDEGKIGHIGLSKVTPESIRLAGKYISIAAVQNVLNLNDRYDPALELCRDDRIAQMRRITAVHLRYWQVPESLRPEVILVVSELVTNSVVHGRGQVGLRISSLLQISEEFGA